MVCGGKCFEPSNHVRGSCSQSSGRSRKQQIDEAIFEQAVIAMGVPPANHRNLSVQCGRTLADLGGSILSHGVKGVMINEPVVGLGDTTPHLT